MIRRAQKLAGCAVLLASLLPSAALAQPPGWSAPQRAGASLGLLAVQCDDREFCFAIACPDGQLQLVNMSPGGGPYGNPDMGAAGGAATLTTAGGTFRLSFVWDDGILPELGIAGSRAALPAEALWALADKPGRIAGTTTGPMAATLANRGLKAMLPHLTAKCGLTSPSR
jgi:hypothetical protein